MANTNSSMAKNSKLSKGYIHFIRSLFLLLLLLTVANLWAQEPATTVIYLDGTNGNDANDGLTPDKAVKTIDKANSKLKTVAEGGTWDNNIIVLVGRTSSGASEGNCFKSKGTNPATITGKWNGLDYGGVINMVKGGESGANPGDGLGKTGFHNYVSADTKFENLTFQAAHVTDNIFLELHSHDVWLGKGLKMTGFRNLSRAHGNLGMEETVPELSVILTSTNPKHPEDAYWTRTKPQTLTIESGHYGRILGGRYTSAFFPNGNNTSKTILATALHPAWAVINIDIDPDNDMTGKVSYSEGPNKGKNEERTYTCDINCIVAGLTDGSIFGDYEINIRGGVVRYAVGANQGNSVVNGDKTFTPVGGTSGKWGQWPNASFFGRTIINVEQGNGLKPIEIKNLFAGGLGRQANESDAVSIVVDMYVYGHTEINMKSGTVTGSIYGGGAGGVLGNNPWDPHAPHVAPGTPSSTADANKAIINGVQYGDTRVTTGVWSTQSPEDPLIDVVLHQCNADGHFISDGAGNYPTETLNLTNSSTTLNVSGGTIKGNVFGGGDGYVSNMPVLGAVQGVGSVFGTSNINITGGIIEGSIYGGSQGAYNYYNQKNKYGQFINHIAEMNGTVNLNITGTAEKYPTIGGEIYGGGKGIISTTNEEYIRIATAGNIELDNENPDKYKTNINIAIDMPSSIEFPNDIYGGGALGLVDGNTNIILKQGKFTGSIYGGGYGEKGHLDKAMVTGSTNIYTGAANFADVDRDRPVSIEPSATNTPTIYGGGNMAKITGNTFVNIWHGNITADVFGGGKGLSKKEDENVEFGKVTGNTRVIINNPTENNQITGNVYGGGALGAVQGNTLIVFQDGVIEGDVFGGGQGEDGAPEKAKVTGDTHVIVDKNWTPTQ